MINTFKKNIQIRNKTAITFFGFLFFVIGFSSYQTSQAQVVSTLATPPASLCNITRDLNFGMVSPDVKELQKYLNNNGSPLAQVGFGSKGQETNNFVNLTRNALIKFQQDNKIPATIGVFDLPTRDFLGCKKPAAFQFTRDLKFGMVSPDVKELQKYLNNNGFPLAQNGVGSKGKETTFFGSLTKEALIKYQNSKLHTIADSARLIAENGNLFVNTRNVINGKQQPGNGSILSYTLTYTADAGGTISGTASQTVNSGSDGSAVSAVPNIGYYFTSWSDVSTTTPRIDINVTANKNVTANFAYRGGSGGGSSPSVTTYTLTYTADVGGTISGTSSQTVNSGSDGSAVSAVPNTGYYFTSWSDGSTSNPRTDINISADKSITASFAYRRHSGSVRKYTLTYTADAGGTISGSASQTVNSGSDGSAVSAIPNIGYHFTTWSDTLATATRTDVNVISNISVTASFAIDTHTVNFDKNTGDTEANPTTRLVDYNATTTLPTAPTKTGYTFDSWNTAADGSGTTFTGSTTVTENITVYAKWTATSQTLTFESNGGSAVSAITQNFGTSISAPANPTKTGYTFAGWYNEVGLTTVHTFDTMGLSTTVYAKWTVNTYTVTYDANGSTGGTLPSNQTKTHDLTLVLADNSGALVKTGYTFAGWNTLTNGSGTDYATSSNYTTNASVTMFAKWTATSQTLTFESNGGSAVSAITQNFGTSISAPANPTKTGYTFAGWYNEVGLTTVHTFDTMGLSTTVYAKWTAIPFTCGNNVTFTYNGSSVTYGTVNNSTTGRCWLDRNLGATRVALSSTDSAAYGDLFQWGRPADGHQIRTSGTQSGPVATITPGTNTFIKISPDWSSIDSDGALRSAYLAKTDGTGICPAGFRLPTDTEINAERLSWSSNNSAGAFASPLKLTVAGDRGYVSGSLFNVGVGGLYRSSSIYGGTNSGYLFFTGGDAGAMVSTPRSSGLTVRCLKD